MVGSYSELLPCKIFFLGKNQCFARICVNENIPFYALSIVLLNNKDLLAESYAMYSLMDVTTFYYLCIIYGYLF